MMTIEDLRGREFVHFKDESDVYIVGKGRDGRTVINWKGSADTTVYRDGEIENFFERGIWILL